MHNIRPAGKDAIDRAAAILRAGGLVAFPTETVYGLGADATNDRAVAAIFEAKGRPRFNPLIVHLPAAAALEGIAELDARARDVAARFWPGPLTIRFEPGKSLPTKVRKALTKATGRIGIRIPAAKVCAGVTRSFGAPMLVSSANRSKKSGAQSLAQVRKNFGNAFFKFCAA